MTQNPMKPADSSARPMTFRAIDEATGVYLGDIKPEGWPLEIWYAKVYDVPLETLTVFDLARTCRQHAACGDYLPYVMPLCLDLLKKEPFAGELYDGELLNAVISLPKDYWVKHPEQRKLAEVVSSATLEIYKGLEEYMDEDGWLYPEDLDKQITRFLTSLA